MSSFKQYMTRDTANEGAKLHVVSPDGSLSDDFLIILSTDSDAFIHEETAILREVAFSVNDNNDKDDPVEKARKNKLRLACVLIKSWSFDEKCNPENKLEFLKNSPRNADSVDIFANQPLNFFKKKQKSLKSGTKRN